MATLTVYGDLADAYIETASTTYSLAQDGTGAAVVTANPLRVGQALAGSTYIVYESFFGFDTSSLGASASISAVVLSLYVTSDMDATANTYRVRAYDWGAAVATGDWVNDENVSAQTLCATHNQNFTASAYNDFTESGTDFQTSVNKTGTTNLFAHTSRFEAGTAPFANEYVDFQRADNAGTTQDPKLVVTYTSGSTGTGALALPFLSVSGTGVKSYPGTGALSLPFLSVAGTGTQTIAATAAISLPFLSVAGSGLMQPSGTGALSLPFLSVSGTGVKSYPGTAALTLPWLTVSGTGVSGYAATAAIVLPFLSVSGTGVMQPSGTGALTLPFLVVSGTGTQTIAGTGALTLPWLSLAATGVMQPSGTGALTLPFLVVAGTGTQTISGTGALVLPFLVFAGSGSLPSVATAALVLPFIVFAATGVNRGVLLPPRAGTARATGHLPAGAAERTLTLLPGTARPGLRLPPGVARGIL